MDITGKKERDRIDRVDVVEGEGKDAWEEGKPETGRRR